jgi:long-chain acyl-CoA synthetase
VTTASGQRFNVAEAIFARADPRGIAVVGGGVAMSYGELDSRSAAVARRLREAVGAARCARIGLRCPDGAGYIVLALGILRAGACFVPVAPELAAAERGQLADTIALGFLLTSESGSDIGFQIEPAGRPAEPPWAEALAALNPAFIRFSSGTTGRSKGILISHESLRERVEAANAGLGIGPDDRILWVLAMSHHFAVSIILYLWHGATIVLPASHLAGDILASAVEHRATVIYAAPFHYQLLAGDVGQTQWPTLRLAVSTTAALPPETGTAFDRAFGVFPSQALGIIEVGLPCLNVPDPRSCPSSVGRVQPAFSCELRDPGGRPAAPGEPGELFLKGPGMLDAYIEPWQPRAEAAPGGWFATGDLAEADAQGRIRLVGRTRSIISVGGMKFFPEEVEAVLLAHPLVSDARVFGRPHPTFGMVPVAEIVGRTPAPTEREIFAFCRARLARYKVPMEVAFVGAIARTASGKIRRVPASVPARQT